MDISGTFSFREQRFRDLRLVFAGRESCSPLHSWGPAVRPNYIIHYILEGKGIYQCGNETWDLHAREGFLIEPETQTFYQADAQTPWTYCWVGFDGDLAADLIREMGLGEERLTFFCEAKEELEQIFEKLMKYQQLSEENDLILESELYRLFALLIKNMNVTERGSSPQRNDYVQGAVRFIRNNYYNPISVEDIAAYTGINRSYLYTLFREETGMSPSEYLMTFRLTRAAELLRLTGYSIESIAYSCGYQDPLVFSKAFKRKYAITPLKYRRIEQEKNQILQESDLQG